MICLRQSDSLMTKIKNAANFLADLEFDVTALDHDYLEGQLEDLVLSITWSEEQVVLEMNVKQSDDSMVSVEGNIGIGKSTLTHRLSELGFGQLQPEDVNLQLLKKFYEDPKQYGFAFQLYMLAHRLAQAKQTCVPSVIDRGILGDAAFASVANVYGNISNDDFAIYCNILQTAQIMPNHITVYLTAAPATCLRRLQDRNREGEENIDLSYLETIDRAHFRMVIASMLEGNRTIIADWEQFGHVHDLALQLIKVNLTGRGHEQWVTLDHGYPIDWSQDHDEKFRQSVWQRVMANESVQLQNYMKK